MNADAQTPNHSKNQSYTFHSYFEMPYDPDEILAKFSYSLNKSRLSLPKTTRQLNRLQDLQERIEDSLVLVSISKSSIVIDGHLIAALLTNLKLKA